MVVWSWEDISAWAEGCGVGEWGWCVCACACCVESEGSLGASLCMVYESQAPSTAVQCRQKELLGNVTAVRADPSSRGSALRAGVVCCWILFFFLVGSSFGLPLETLLPRRLSSCHSLLGWLIGKASYISSCWSSFRIDMEKPPSIFCSLDGWKFCYFHQVLANKPSRPFLPKYNS